GMFVKLTIQTQPAVPLLSVPEIALQPGNQVYRVKQGKLEVVQLRNVSLADNQVLVPVSETGLQPGDTVIITSVMTASDGMRVRLRTSATANAEASEAPST